MRRKERKKERFPTLVVRQQGACHRRGMSIYMYNAIRMSQGHVQGRTCLVPKPPQCSKMYTLRANTQNPNNNNQGIPPPQSQSPKEDALTLNPSLSLPNLLRRLNYIHDRTNKPPQPRTPSLSEPRPIPHSLNNHTTQHTVPLMSTTSALPH